MKEYVIFLFGAAIFGFILGITVTYIVIKKLNEWKKEDKFNKDCINNGK